jgi:hypothetical protein
MTPRLPDAASGRAAVMALVIAYGAYRMGDPENSAPVYRVRLLRMTWKKLLNLTNSNQFLGEFSAKIGIIGIFF